MTGSSKKPVGITRSNSNFINYYKWLEENDLPYIILDWEKNNFDDIKKCSALLLTGGVDIFPEFYNDWEDGKKREDYIPARDGFEFKLLEFAFENKYPVLGICRGLQVINCKLNGSLINDIETIRNTNHRKISETEDRLHGVNVKSNTLLLEVVGETSGIINSSHHQAIDRLGEGLLVSARADDGIIEAIEWETKTGKPFMLAVQWHPERMPDKNSRFSKNIIDKFREEIYKDQ
ncbi:MAG TPA: gamma-glutamyl-gamma-aminobutyrate hydrolase family protein [Ignavibacteria bacterium]|nr:peptidase C26 [Bacteroidota bacterium]HRE11880.1 gamma-glutamyl-gamma-aminobutyrate hydrolase family protein [Ignavibacteria bacterium]HRF64991.1 gamma-glutamyl-gamma-aminobutyrate hydrolase family protein [Ignavibacteria bacterium]HRJ03418.1 gamma-glutamyl-gamma-aminobutyrate hydrolase family protein [Ignavibacteria bacterium]